MLYEAVQTAQVEEREHTLPAPPQGPVVQLLSVDGALVPLAGEGAGMRWARPRHPAGGAAHCGVQ